MDGEVVLAPVEPHRSGLPKTMIRVLALVLERVGDLVGAPPAFVTLV
jgi:hypothetical protein